MDEKLRCFFLVSESVSRWWMFSTAFKAPSILKDLWNVPTTRIIQDTSGQYLCIPSSLKWGSFFCDSVRGKHSFNFFRTLWLIFCFAIDSWMSWYLWYIDAGNVMLTPWRSRSKTSIIQLVPNYPQTILYNIYIYYIYIYIPPSDREVPPNGMGPQVAPPLPFYLRAIGSISEVQPRIC